MPYSYGKRHPGFGSTQADGNRELSFWTIISLKNNSIMKTFQLLLTATCLLASTFLTAQVTNNLQLPTSINADGSVPDPSAQLDV